MLIALQARAMVSMRSRRSALISFLSRWRATRNCDSVTRLMRRILYLLANHAPPSRKAASTQNTGAMPTAVDAAPEASGMSVWLPLRSEVRRPTASPGARAGGGVEERHDDRLRAAEAQAEHERQQHERRHALRREKQVAGPEMPSAAKMITHCLSFLMSTGIAMRTVSVAIAKVEG